MRDFTNAHNRYLDPPDEPEAVLCDNCGEEMDVKEDLDGTHYTKCTNQYCPAKFEGVAREMAELLIGAREEVKSLARKLNYKARELDRIVEAMSSSGLE